MRSTNNIVARVGSGDVCLGEIRAGNERSDTFRQCQVYYGMVFLCGKALERYRRGQLMLGGVRFGDVLDRCFMVRLMFCGMGDVLSGAVCFGSIRWGNVWCGVGLLGCVGVLSGRGCAGRGDVGFDLAWLLFRGEGGVSSEFVRIGKVMSAMAS